MIEISPSVLREYGDLFGEKTVNGRRISVEGLIEELTRELRAEIDRVIRARREWLNDKRPLKLKAAFPSWEEKFTDADGNVRTFREIVQGLIDNLLGRDTPLRWGLNWNTPVPDDLHPLKNPGLEITGPWSPMSRAIHQINADVASMMEDEEDASPAWYIPRGSGRTTAAVWEARRIVNRVLRGDVPQPYYEGGKEYRIKKPREKWPTLIHRVPGLHILDFDIRVDGNPVPAIITSVVIYTVNNYDLLKRAGSGVYFYVPKVQTPDEALVVEKLLRRVEDKLGLRRGELKIAMLYEEARAGLYLPVIFWIWRERLVKSNNGRWDYLGSLIEMWKDEAVYPDPQNITMTHPVMMAYQKWNALMCLMAGLDRQGKLNAGPVGGMAAVMLYRPDDPYQRHRFNQRALRAIWLDKLRERLIGLIFVTEEPVKKVTLRDVLEGKVKGRLFDLFRQSWVATPEESYVKAGNEPLRASLEELQQMINRPVKFVEVDGVKIPTVDSGLTEQERQLFIRLGLLDEQGNITPWVIRPDMLDTPEKLLGNPELWGGKDLWTALFEPPKGDITAEHIQHAFYMAANYGFQLLNGNLAAAIDDYELGQRFMNDLATYRIFSTWLWTLLRHNAVITKDGAFKGPARTGLGVIPAEDRVKVAAGTRFTEELFDKLWDLHMEWTLAFYEDLDRIAAERILHRFVNRVRSAVAEAYKAGPFRYQSPRDTAKKIAESITVEELERAVVENQPRFDRSFAPVIMEILRAKLKSPMYLQHGGRLIMALAPLPDEERDAVLRAIFSPREEVERLVKEGKLKPYALELYDYVHDVR
ncbi:malate synthase [Pyrobaculum arsenaticum]|uniref:malate synthase n=2 Tax=Pyrobaculum arsenaticum TaxID=121277 RepID=A4WI67_PYRAR|nr:malate synthase [Pyrobaculum arsenaticum]ABP50084.1 malate synthase [Pyrobaculum arsenaticum DSM 13514]NYR14945.1 malate synthase [Pyrobaculum arsenaticum]